MKRQTCWFFFRHVFLWWCICASRKFDVKIWLSHKMYLFIKFPMVALESMPQIGAFSIHSNPWSCLLPRCWNSCNKIVIKKMTKYWFIFWTKFLKWLHTMMIIACTCYRFLLFHHSKLWKILRFVMLLVIRQSFFQILTYK